MNDYKNNNKNDRMSSSVNDKERKLAEDYLDLWQEFWIPSKGVLPLIQSIVLDPQNNSSHELEVLPLLEVKPPS
jgi:hypothetical protein